MSRPTHQFTLARYALLLSLVALASVLPFTSIAADLSPGNHSLRGESVQICNAIGTATIVAGDLVVDSGSGGVTFTRLTAPRIAFDTGSGGVTADLVRSPESLLIDSGSGGVKVRAPRDLDARLEISCSKRHLDLGLPVVASRSTDDYFEGTAGAGRGRIVIDSGSGRVSLRAAEEFLLGRRSPSR